MHIYPKHLILFGFSYFSRPKSYTSWSYSSSAQVKSPACHKAIRYRVGCLFLFCPACDNEVVVDYVFPVYINMKDYAPA
jgi:competence CoiA-like predicted nuclease